MISRRSAHRAFPHTAAALADVDLAVAELEPYANASPVVGAIVAALRAERATLELAYDEADRIRREREAEAESALAPRVWSEKP